jgi:hypothetical protein
MKIIIINYVVAEHSVNKRKLFVKIIGYIRRENADMSSEL